MGEVSRATDARLDRQVAIKVLPEGFALDGERPARFEREVKMRASRNHPNTAGIDGLEQTGNSHALVLEGVDSEDLSERMPRGALPVDPAWLHIPMQLQSDPKRLQACRGHLPFPFTVR